MRLPPIVLALGLLSACRAAPPAPAPQPMPPPPLAEARPLPPVSGKPLIWRPGHQDWTGRDYVWVPGRYIPRGQAGAGSWLMGYWAPDGSGWRWIPAHWM